MIDKKLYDMPKETDLAWCPGCGNFPLLNIVKLALAELDIAPSQAVICSGIGQAAKTPHYLRVNYFNGLHGRALPPAIAIKVANPSLTVIAESGDGDTYGEGGNHFLHTIRRNPDIVNIVHDNMIYGLTKGQASPTSEKGLKNPIQTEGVIVEPFNPLALALSLDATFVARAFSGDIPQTKEIVKAAIRHSGYALVDVFQPCVVFNKLNTYQWFKEKSYYVDETHDKTDRMQALALAFDLKRLALGIIYQRTGKPPYETLVRSGQEPLYGRSLNTRALSSLLDTYK